jgi:serine/threonine-protein kinase
MNHPNVVRTFDFGCLYSMAYVVLEWIDGCTLQQLLSRVGALPARAALELLQGICAGLAHAHDLQIGGIHLGLVHGDVKPSNVLIDQSGVPKVIDFGASQCSSDEGIPVEQDSSFGTPSYLSPEQALGALIDRRSDLFSMATLAYEVVTGKRLFGPSNTVRNAADTGALSAITRKASEEVESLVPGLGSILRGCWSELPEQRFSSAHAVSAALAAIQLDSVDSPSLAECIHQGSDLDTHDVGIESTVPLH